MLIHLISNISSIVATESVSLTSVVTTMSSAISAMSGTIGTMSCAEARALVVTTESCTSHVASAESSRVTASSIVSESRSLVEVVTAESRTLVISSIAATESRTLVIAITSVIAVSAGNSANLTPGLDVDLEAMFLLDVLALLDGREGADLPGGGNAAGDQGLHVGVGAELTGHGSAVFGVHVLLDLLGLGSLLKLAHLLVIIMAVLKFRGRNISVQEHI